MFNEPPSKYVVFKKNRHAAIPFTHQALKKVSTMLNEWFKIFY
jgi:hypothetical protein